MQRALGHVRHGSHGSRHDAHDSGRQRRYGARRDGLRHQRDDPWFQRFPLFPSLISRPSPCRRYERDRRTDGSQPVANDRRRGVLYVPRRRRLHPSGARRARRRDRADEAAGDAISSEHVRVAAHSGEVQPREVDSERGRRGGVVQAGDGVDVHAESGRSSADVEAPRARLHRRDRLRRDRPRDQPGRRARDSRGSGGGHAADHQEHGARGEPPQQQLEPVQGALRGDLRRTDDPAAPRGRGGLRAGVQGAHRARCVDHRTRRGGTAQRVRGGEPRADRGDGLVSEAGRGQRWLRGPRPTAGDAQRGEYDADRRKPCRCLLPNRRNIGTPRRAREPVVF